MAFAPKLIPVLVGMDIAAFSVPTQRITEVRRILESVDAAEANELSRKALSARTVAEVAHLLDIPWIPAESIKESRTKHPRLQLASSRTSTLTLGRKDTALCHEHLHPLVAIRYIILIGKNLSANSAYF